MTPPAPPALPGREEQDGAREPGATAPPGVEGGRSPGAIIDGELDGREDGRLRRPRRPPAPPYDGMAIAALVVSLVGLHLVGVVLGHLALARTRESGRRGRGVATAALVIGYAGLALALAGWILYFAVLAPVVTLPG